jgi:hypothetical protein
MARPPQTRPLESRVATSLRLRHHASPPGTARVVHAASRPRLKPASNLFRLFPRFNILTLLTFLTVPLVGYGSALRRTGQQRRARDGVDQSVLHRLLRAEFCPLGEPLKHL